MPHLTLRAYTGPTIARGVAELPHSADRGQGEGPAYQRSRRQAPSCGQRRPRYAAGQCTHGKTSHALAGSRAAELCAVAAPPSLKQLEEALELDPRSPILHYNMGQAREVIGEMEGAIAEYKLSLDNDIRYMDGAPPFARLAVKHML